MRLFWSLPEEPGAWKKGAFDVLDGGFWEALCEGVIADSLAAAASTRQVLSLTLTADYGTGSTLSVASQHAPLRRRITSNPQLVLTKHHVHNPIQYGLRRPVSPDQLRIRVTLGTQRRGRILRRPVLDSTYFRVTLAMAETLHQPGSARSSAASHMHSCVVRSASYISVCSSPDAPPAYQSRTGGHRLDVLLFYLLSRCMIVAERQHVVSVPGPNYPGHVCVTTGHIAAHMRPFP